MGFFTWCGRVTLWVVFWPVGLWRSFRHGERKRAKKMEQIIREVHHLPPSAEIYRTHPLPHLPPPPPPPR
jgi:hypothetical protein